MAAGVMALSIVAGGSLQLVPLPDGGPSRAGAAVTPLPTPTALTGGRVSNDGPPAPSGGFHSDYAVAGGCQQWGTDYVGTTFATVSSTTYGAWSVTASGDVADERGVTSKNLPFHGSLQSIGQCPDHPVIGIAHTPSSDGYWIATAGGGVFSTMGAPFRGSRGTGQFTTGPTKAMKAIVADPVATGYWLVDQLGQVYWYGPTTQPTEWHGNAPSTLAAKRAFDGDSVVAMAATPTGGGYWLLTNYGTVFAIGSPAQGAMSKFTDPGPGSDPANLYVGIVSGPGGNGFWLVRDDGTTYAFGETYFGNHPPSSTGDTMVAITSTQGDASYLLMNISGQFYQGTGAPGMTNNPYTTVPKKTTLPKPSPAGTSTEQVAGGGNPVTNGTPPCAADPVNCESGDLWETDADVTVPGNGQHLDLSRTYNSESASTLGTFGYGWSSSYMMSVSDTPNVSATVTEADGSTVTFYTNTTGIFVAPTGTLATLARKPTGGYTFVLRNTTTYTFNADGWLVAEKDLDDYTTTLAYNGGGQLTSVTDPSGRAVDFSYNATGLVASVENPAGQVTSYGYTTEDLTSVTDPAGRVTRYTYDATHRLVTETSPTGGVTTTTYGTRGKVVRQVDGTDLTTTWTYAGTNATSGTTTITGPEGSVTKETFSDGQMVEKTTAYGTTSAATWHYTYTSTTFGQTSVTDPDGNTATTTYNATGDVTSTTDATGNKTTTTYNSFNEPLVTTSPMGITTTDTYDPYGNLVKSVVRNESSSQTTTYTVCETATCKIPYLWSWYRGEVEAEVDPAGHRTTEIDDTYGDPLATVTYPSTGKTEIVQDTYNVLGQKVCQATAPAVAQGITCPSAGDPHVPATTTWTYDADGEVVAETNGLTQTTTTAYDVLSGTGDCTASVTAAAYCTVTTGPTGDVTVTYDDQDGRTVGTVSGAGTSTSSTTTTAYDVPVGQAPCTTFRDEPTATHCKATTNGDGEITADYLNAATEVLVTNVRSVGSTTFTYNATGDLVTKTTAAGVTTDGYNKDNQLTSVTYSDTGSAYPSPGNVTYTYNADGQRTKMTDGSGTTTYTYDALGQLQSSTDGAGKTVSYAYNGDDQVTTLTYTDTKTVHRAYNGDGQMTSTTDLAGRTTTFGYSLTPAGVPGGSQTTTTDPDGQTETTTDNVLGQQVTATFSDRATVWKWTVLPGSTYTASISCPSTTLCVTAKGTSVWTSTDPTGGMGDWQATTLPVTTPSGGGFTAVSCPSTTLCLAATTTGDLFSSSDPTGGAGSWTETRTGGRRTWGLSTLSCPSSSLCVEIDRGTIEVSTDPTSATSTWTTVALAGTGFTEVDAVACPTTSFCMAGTGTGQVYTTSDPTGPASDWQRGMSFGSRAITAISCVSTTLCVAVSGLPWAGSSTDAWEFSTTDPTASTPTWDGGKLAGNLAATAVACASTSFCMATGSDGAVWTSSNPSGKSSSGQGWMSTWAYQQRAGTSLGVGLACPSSTACVGTATSTGNLGMLSVTSAPKESRVAETYTANDLVASETETFNEVTTEATYGYDAQGQLTSSSEPGVPGATGTYAYDGAGDPTTVVTPRAGASVTQTFNTGGELTEATSTARKIIYWYNGIHGQTLATETEPSYGRLRAAHYDQTGEIGAISASSTWTDSTTFVYNGDGLRMRTTWKLYGGTHGTQEFTWDTETSTPELLSDGSYYFIYGPNGQVLEQEDATATLKDPLFLVHDGLGSTVATVDGTATLSSYTYNPYGAVIKHTGTGSTPIGFAGAYTDTRSSLLYMEHRFYTPGTGEFLSVDPDVATTGEPYEYATDDPVNEKDAGGDNPDCTGVPGSTIVATYRTMKRSNNPVYVGGGYITATLRCTGYNHIVAENHLRTSQLTWFLFTKAISETLNSPTFITYQPRKTPNTDRYLYEKEVDFLTGTEHYNALFIVVRYRFSRQVITAWATDPGWKYDELSEITGDSSGGCTLA